MTFTEFSCKKNTKNWSNHVFWLQILNYETCVLQLYYTTTYCNEFFCCVCKLVIVLYLSSEVKPRSSAGLTYFHLCIYFP